MNEGNNKLYMRDFSLSMTKNITNHFSENYDARVDNELSPLLAMMGYSPNYAVLAMMGYSPNYAVAAYWRKYHNAALNSWSWGVVIFDSEEDKFEFLLTFG